MSPSGVASLSLIVSVTGAGAVTPWLFVAVPDTVTVLSGASTVLFTLVTVTVPVLVVAPRRNRQHPVRAQL